MNGALPFPIQPQGPMNGSAHLHRLVMRSVKCSCGSEEFEPKPVVMLQYNVLEPEKVSIVQGQKLKCIRCPLYVKQTKDGWTSVPLDGNEESG